MYVLPRDLVPKLYAASEYFPSIFIEDLYLTGCLGKILNVTHFRVRGFTHKDYDVGETCTLASGLLERKIVLAYPTQPEVMLKTWTALRGENRNCSNSKYEQLNDLLP